ncbi:MAG: carbonic anhydrase [Acidimicrobiia bacterium]|nr:carbonic anhydrase [Acidimicrobiia bacterium]MBT8216946.1 carbonic anhydrase [Acidimicrobiia bacterium]NNF10500.1 carbonic anhydrase [Acidimicrobiia bacterium]NNL69054.1 carbonic anhydrase [Acidimicrobiia bacterium]
MGPPDELLERNARFADHFEPSDGSASPSRRLAVLTCMDTRIDVLGALGLHVGEAHIIRNAGGILTDDVIRSLSISQRRLATTEVVIVQHTDCGMQGLDEGELRDELQEAVGAHPAWEIGSFSDVAHSVLTSIERLRADPHLVHRDRIHGYVYDVQTGRLTAVDGGP